MISRRGVRWLIRVCVMVTVSAGCSAGDGGAGCPGGTDYPEGPALEYRVDFQPAFDERVRTETRRLVDHIDGEGTRGTVEFRDDEGATVVVDDPRDAELVDRKLDQMPVLRVGDRGEKTWRLELGETAAESLRNSILQKLVTSASSRLRTEGFDNVHVGRRETDGIAVMLPEGVGDEEIEGAKKAVEDRGNVRLVAVADDEAVSWFGQLEDELPDGAELRRLGGEYATITHDDRDVLREFFDGRTPEGRFVGFQHVEVAGESGDSEQVAAESDLVDDEMLEESKTPAASYWRSYLLEEEAPLEGRHVRDARVGIDDRLNRPYVALIFGETGTEKLAEFTTDHVGNRIAIAVGDEVHSAPVIEQPVTEGRIQMQMGRMSSFREAQQEARDLVALFRSRALPLSLELERIRRPEK